MSNNGGPGGCRGTFGFAIPRLVEGFDSPPSVFSMILETPMAIEEWIDETGRRWAANVAAHTTVRSEDLLIDTLTPMELVKLAIERDGQGHGPLAEALKIIVRLSEFHNGG